MNLGSRIAYIAWRRGTAPPTKDRPHVPGVELGAIYISANASAEERTGAIAAMRRKCAEHAGLA
jgi:hypothetical protein